MSGLIIVSNRLPITIERDEDGFHAEASSGGLVSALNSALRDQGFTWIGWTGTDYRDEVETVLTQLSAGRGCEFIPVHMSAEERASFYCGFCNEILWPLFHDLQSRCNFDPGYWETYCAINRRFAEVVERTSSNGDELIWVHDYHLLLLASLLRGRINSGKRLAYFHHIPFPTLDIFSKLPWRKEILQGLVSFDLLGFQTRQDLRNFMSCARRYLADFRAYRVDRHFVLNCGSNCVRLGEFPIGIDFEAFSSCAKQTAIIERAREIRSQIGATKLILGVDRLDYTKGIPERLKAFDIFLRENPELHGRVAFVQVVVPSRSDIPKYHELRLEVERLVSTINGRFGEPGWVPIQYIYRHLGRSELIALYRAADIGLITPLRDGMNLVAKEFCAAQIDNDAVLILSEFAGAARQLSVGAMLVNPYDAHGVASALRQAYDMPPAKKRQRMRRLRRSIETSSVYRWYSDFVNTAHVAATALQQRSGSRLIRKAQAAASE